MTVKNDKVLFHVYAQNIQTCIYTNIIYNYKQHVKLGSIIMYYYYFMLKNIKINSLAQYSADLISELEYYLNK